jgi:hypothetical protein
MSIDDRIEHMVAMTRQWQEMRDKRHQMMLVMVPIAERQMAMLGRHASMCKHMFADSQKCSPNITPMKN